MKAASQASGGIESPELRDRWTVGLDAEGRTKLQRFRAYLAELGPGDLLSEEWLDLRAAPLSGWELDGHSFGGCDLSGADMTQAQLKRASFFGARLIATSLVDAQLSEAEFSGADLSRADLRGAHAGRAGFGRANLQGVCFERAQLVNASFVDAKLIGARLGAANADGARFHGADLSHADFRSANLRSTDLSFVVAKQASFDEADLRSAKLSHVRDFKSATWISADLRDAQFAGAWRLRRHILDENYLHELRESGPVGRLVYMLWWVTSDCGRSLLRWGLLSVVLTLTFATAYTLVDIDFGRYETSFSPIYFSVVTMTSLGYGDAVPVSFAGQLVCVLNVVCGYVQLGGALAILTNRFARRAE